MSKTPHPLRKVELIAAKFASTRANAPIELGRAPVEVVFDGATLQGDGIAHLRFLPSECVIVSARFPQLPGKTDLFSRRLMMRFGDQKQAIPTISVKASHPWAEEFQTDLVPSRGRFEFAAIAEFVCGR